MGIRCPKCKGILSPHAKRCPEPDCGWSVVPEGSKVYQEMAAPLVQAGRDAVDQKRQEQQPSWEGILLAEQAGPETLKEREWATATRDERFQMVVDTVESLQKRLAGVEDRSISPWPPMRDPAVAAETVKDLAQRLAAAELAIKSLQEKAESLDKSSTSLIRGLYCDIAAMKHEMHDTVDCPPACECQPVAEKSAGPAPIRISVPGKYRMRNGEEVEVTGIRYGYAIGFGPHCPLEWTQEGLHWNWATGTSCSNRSYDIVAAISQPSAEFTVEQMAYAISAAAACLCNILTEHEQRALRAARDHILAGKPVAAKPCGTE